MNNNNNEIIIIEPTVIMMMANTAAFQAIIKTAVNAIIEKGDVKVIHLDDLEDDE